jgi:hypothetical protein
VAAAGIGAAANPVVASASAARALVGATPNQGENGSAVAPAGAPHEGLTDQLPPIEGSLASFSLSSFRRGGWGMRAWSEYDPELGFNGLRPGASGAVPLVVATNRR